MFLNRTNEVLSPGYLPFETGFRRLDPVQIEVAALHRLHGVNGYMLEWWMRQIGSEDWLERQHQKSRVKREWVEKPAEGEFIGATFLIEADVVERRTWRVRYHDAAEIVDTSRFEDMGISFATCARIGAAEAPFWAGKFLQVCRDTEFGCEVRNRYWFGDTGRKDETPDADTLALVTTDTFAAGMLAYDLEAMEQVEAFLPDLYARRRDSA